MPVRTGSWFISERMWAWGKPETGTFNMCFQMRPSLSSSSEVS